MAVQLQRSFLLIADIYVALFSVIQKDPKPLSSLLKRCQPRGETKSPFLQRHSHAGKGLGQDLELLSAVGRAS